MLYKDSLLLTFFLDQDDPDVASQSDELWTLCSAALTGSGAGICDTRAFNTKGGYAEWTFAGNDADIVLASIRPLVLAADFIIGPRATLIIRQRGTSGVQVRHLDL